uniref:GIY-YIG homing endonuclease n=1 Tax=Cyathus pallidus TaxID=380665 RepID=UPI00255208EC|nr:GIY-YIG homing endonuclease [Cyathus pallidus]WEV87303.1 GIY-YIG homing endonuclease [Cyathus pallidus]
MIKLLSIYDFPYSFLFEDYYPQFYYLGGTVLVKIPFGPHILPTVSPWRMPSVLFSKAETRSTKISQSENLNKPVRIYKPKLDRNLIGTENKNRTIIYQWINLINGKRYVGSAWNGSRRLLSYWTPSVLKRNYPIYKSICFYTHNNFMLVILEDLGNTGSVTKEYLLSREQLYLDLLFKFYPLLNLNQSPTAGTNLGFKHTPELSISRSGALNPMKGKQFSSEFLFMQKRNKKGANNPLFGTKKSEITLSKLIKLVYVYNAYDGSFIGTYPTIKCIKTFKLGKDTLSKYLKSGLPFKGKIYSRAKLEETT